MTKKTFLPAMAMWLTISLISLYDGWLTVKYRSQLPTCEENPVARLILRHDNWEVKNFLIIKALGTVTVIATLIGLCFYRRDFGLTVAAGVALFQLALLFFYLGLDDLCF